MVTFCRFAVNVICAGLADDDPEAYLNTCSPLIHALRAFSPVLTSAMDMSAVALIGSPLATPLSLLLFTVRILPLTVSFAASAASLPLPSLRFHVMASAEFESATAV